MSGSLRAGRHATLLLALLCAACASPAPAVRLHTLLPETLPQPVAAALPGHAALAFVLDPVKIPASVDQPQWLVRRPDQSLALLEQDRWASPLADELHAALAERLRLRFGMRQARSAAERQAAAVRITVELTRFESIPAREVRVEATWLLSAPRTRQAESARQGGQESLGAARRSLESPLAEGAAIRCGALIVQPVDAGIDALAAGHRQAVARLGDAIGDQLLEWQQTGAMHCVAPPPPAPPAAAPASTVPTPAVRAIS